MALCHTPAVQTTREPPAPPTAVRPSKMATKDEKEATLARTRKLKPRRHLDLRALEGASSALKDDKDFMLHVMDQNGNALAYVSARLKDDTDFMMAAMALNGRALKHASVAMKNNKDVVLAALAQNGSVLLKGKHVTDFRKLRRGLRLRGWRGLPPVRGYPPVRWGGADPVFTRVRLPRPEHHGGQLRRACQHPESPR